MFETFGSITKPAFTMWPCVLALWPLVASALCLAERPRKRALCVLFAGGVAHLVTLGVLFRLPADSRFLLSSLGVAARSGQLDLTLSLGLDPLAAVACAGTCGVAALLVARQGGDARRRIALLGALASAVELVILADSAPMLVLAGALASGIGALLGRAPVAMFVADRVADVAIVAAAAVAFWALGGQWIDGQYVPELEARVVVARSEAAAAQPRAPLDEDDEERSVRAPRGGRASLSLDGLPGSAVMLDGAWLRARSPLAETPIAAGSHALRVHPGGGSNDYVIPHIEASQGDHVWVVARGPTTSFHEARNDLAMHEAGTARASREAFARRCLPSGFRAGAVVLILVGLAFAARARLLPFMPSSLEPARVLSGLACIGIARAYTFAELAARMAALVVSGILLGSLVAWMVALRRKDARALLSAELGFVLASVFAGATWVGVLHALIAAYVLHRSRWPSRVLAFALVPTHLVIVAALYVMPRGAPPTALALVGTGLSLVAAFPAGRAVGQSAVARMLEKTQPAIATTFLGALTVLSVAALGLERALVFGVDQLHRAWRAAGTLVTHIEEVIAALTARAFVPSERVVRLVAFPLALVAALVFVIPWVG